MPLQRIILWDLMDTLVRDPFYRRVPEFFGMSFEQLLAEKHPSAWGQFELGKIDEAQLLASFFRDGRAFDGAGLKRCMIEHCEWLPGMRPLLEELAARDVEMHLLSNYSEWYRHYVEKLGIDALVKPSFVSCHTGVRKPSARAFTHPCEALGVEPERCLFIDDRQGNCDAARAVGMDALRFEGDVDTLRAALWQRGFGPARER